MKLFGRSIAIALACMLVTLPHARANEAAIHKTVAAIRASFEKTKMQPSDPTLYAETVHVSHSNDLGETVDSKTYVAKLAKEAEGASSEPGVKRELTRFLFADNTVVATVLTTGTRSNGEAVRMNITWFMKIGPDGRITDHETWIAPPMRPAAPAATR